MDFGDGSFFQGLGYVIASAGGAAAVVYRARKDFNKQLNHLNNKVVSQDKELKLVKQFQRTKERAWASERREMHNERTSLLQTIKKKDERIIRLTTDNTKLKIIIKGMRK